MVRVLLEARMVRLGYSLRDVWELTREELEMHFIAMPLLLEQERENANADAWFRAALGGR